MNVQPFNSLPISSSLIADLQSDHAGEAGAVQIYRGMLWTTRDPAVRRFALSHIRTEMRHLRFFHRWLPKQHRSRLLPLWLSAGWLLGAFAGFCGRRVSFHTIAAVETFVEKHYQSQIEIMRQMPPLEPLANQLMAFCEDEVDHKIDAQKRLSGAPSLVARIWFEIIAVGSAAGVAVAKRI